MPGSKPTRPETARGLALPRVDSPAIQRAFDLVADALREEQRDPKLPRSGEHGDVFFRGEDGRLHALAIGADGEVLTVADGVPTWEPATGGGITDGDKGDITVSGGGATWTIDPGVVSNSRLADMVAPTFKGRVTAPSGSPEDLTGTQATTMLDTFTAALKGLAPASGGGTTNYLRADGTWAAPPGSGGGVGLDDVLAIGDLL